jgi:acyl carrier protein
MSTESRVNRILVDQLEVDESEVVASAKLRDDLGMDDLTGEELRQTLEEEFKLLIPAENFQQWLTVQDIWDYVEEHQR